MLTSPVTAPFLLWIDCYQSQRITPRIGKLPLRLRRRSLCEVCRVKPFLIEVVDSIFGLNFIVLDELFQQES